MSKPEESSTNEESKIVKHKIELSTSEREKELTKEKETLIGEKATIVKELADIKKKYDEDMKTTKEELDKATKDLEATATQRDDFSQKFTQLAMTRFDAEKKVYLDKLKPTVDEDTYKDIEGKLKGPDELDQLRWSLDLLLKGSETSTNEGTGAKNDAIASPENKGSGGSGTALLEPPKNPKEEPSELATKEFKNPKELIDYLYDRVARGKTIMTKVKAPDGTTKEVERRIGPDIEVEKLVKQLWKKYMDTGRIKGKQSFTLCTQCKGMYEEGTTCPLCGITVGIGPKEDDAGIKRG